MGLEQFAVGFLICLVTVVCAMLFSIFTNFTTDHMDDDGFGYFITMFLACIGLGICLTYILYMNGLV